MFSIANYSLGIYGTPLAIRQGMAKWTAADILSLSALPVVGRLGGQPNDASGENIPMCEVDPSEPVSSFKKPGQARVISISSFIFCRTFRSCNFA
jgi:hypothetical protein